MWDYIANQVHTVSTISTGEYALFLASLESKLDPKKFHCGSCITQYGTSERLRKKTDRKRISKGCFDFTSKNYRLENVRYLTCIGNFAVPIDFYIEAFSLYEKGVLPFEGNISDQPNKIIEIFQLIEVRRAEKIKQNQG